MDFLFTTPCKDNGEYFISTFHFYLYPVSVRTRVFLLFESVVHLKSNVGNKKTACNW